MIAESCVSLPHAKRIEHRHAHGELKRPFTKSCGSICTPKIREKFGMDRWTFPLLAGHRHALALWHHGRMVCAMDERGQLRDWHRFSARSDSEADRWRRGAGYKARTNHALPFSRAEPRGDSVLPGRSSECARHVFGGGPQFRLYAKL